jgi:hypothetical protein
VFYDGQGGQKQLKFTYKTTIKILNSFDRTFHHQTTSNHQTMKIIFLAFAFLAIARGNETIDYDGENSFLNF